MTTHCPKCTDILQIGKQSCRCGWKAEQKARESSVLTPEEERRHAERAVNTLKIYYPEAMEMITEFKKKHGEDWQVELFRLIKPKLTLKPVVIPIATDTMPDDLAISQRENFIATRRNE
jgi:hypothetical protein